MVEQMKVQQMRVVDHLGQPVNSYVALQEKHAALEAEHAELRAKHDALEAKIKALENEDAPFASSEGEPPAATPAPEAGE